MYLEHFQLKSQPFSEHAAVSCLWQDPRMDEGLARLEYLVQCGQLGVVTGQSGVGKSALLKRFLHGLLPQHCQAFYCHLSHLPAAGLLKLVVTQLGESPRRGKERLYEQILERATRAEGTLLLVFDEAHLLDIMPRYFTDELLRRLRNDIPWPMLLKELQWPHKVRLGQLAFVCPRCREYRSAVNPRTNLGRCFWCDTNFNPIEFTMAVQDCEFVPAVRYLKPLLARVPAPSASH